MNNEVNDKATAEALFAEGTAQLLRSERAAAEASLRRALRLDPDLAEAHANLAYLCDQDRRDDEAEAHYRQALQRLPSNARTWLNYGALLARRRRAQEAELAYLKALAADPQSPAAWSNLGALLACEKREDEAEQCHRTALGLDPGHAGANFNLAYLLLRQGRYEEGWARLEHRSWYAAFEERLDVPRWRGESPAGKSLLLVAEAGHGDMIHFGRYAAVLKAAGARRVSVLCHPALCRLFAGLDGCDEALPVDRDFPRTGWDGWVPPLSLPGIFATRIDSIPAALPYLHPDPALAARWAGELADVPGLRVGLAWRGNPRFENDGERSLASLAVLAPLAAVDGVRFFSLQKDAPPGTCAEAPFPLVDLAPEIGNFADSAAIIANLDLVISVDTAIAHLAGALGRPCWVMLPDFLTDWRWLAGRDDSPWYPGIMRLFRQDSGTGSRSGWAPVVERLRAALEDKAGRAATA